MARDGLASASYRGVLRIREFRHLYLAQTVSFLGDQVTAVAVAVLVYRRSGSALLTAVAYAAAWLPAILGGPLLSGLADRFPRRQVLITCDLARAGLLVALALTPFPLPVTLGLLYLLHLAGSPFAAARAALLTEVLTGEAYIVANGLGSVTFQICQIAGLGGAGILVALIGPTPALLLDAASFAGSALVLVLGVRRGTAAASEHAWWRTTRQGVAYVFTDPWLRACLILVWAISACCAAPEAIAVPYARSLHGGPALTGILLAAPAAGLAVGAVVLTRLVRPQARDRLLVPLAALAVTAVTGALLGPGPVLLVGLFVLVGAGMAFTVPLNAVFARRVEPAYRARAMGVAIAGLTAAQGIGFLAAGAAAQTGLRPHTVTGLCGLAGAAAILLTRPAWHRANHTEPTAAAVPDPPAGHQYQEGR